MKTQEYNGTRENPGNWALPNMWLQAEEEGEHPHPSSEVPIPACVPKRAPSDNPFAEFPAPDGGDGARAPFAERLDTQRPKDLLWTKKGEEIFQISKSRSQKLRSRKAHKLLLAPETLLPSFTSLSVVEAGPSSKKPANESSSAVPALVSSSYNGGADESLGEKFNGGLYFRPEGGTATVTPVVNIEVSSVAEESNTYPYYTSVSGSSNHFCSPEIEDWGNLK